MKPDNSRPTWLQKLLGNNGNNKEEQLDKSLSDSTRTEKTSNLDESIRLGANASERTQNNAKIQEKNEKQSYGKLSQIIIDEETTRSVEASGYGM